MVKKVLIVLTSAKAMPWGSDSGFWLEEFAAPFVAFKAQGYQITVASIAGGEPPIDEASLAEGALTEECKEFLADSSDKELLKNTVPISSVIDSAHEYDAVMMPGGHGTVVDFPVSVELKTVIEKVYKNSGIVATVCHGPVCLISPVIDGLPLVHGKKVTGFSDEEETIVGLADKVPFSLEQKLKELGADYVRGPAWGSHVVADGRLITGQNPGSSKAVAAKVIELLNA